MRPREDGKFSSTRDGLAKSSRLLTAVLLVSFSLLSVAWFVFVSGYFVVKHIQTNELYGLSGGEVASTTMEILRQGKWSPWDKANIFFVEKNDLASQLKNRLFAEEVVVDKVYPDILRLMISERQRSVVLVSKDQMLLIDMNGIVTGEATDGVATDTRSILNKKMFADNKHPPVILCELPELAASGYQVTDQETIKVWIEAYRTLISDKVKFRYLTLSEPSAQSLKMTSEAGYQVIYDLGQPLNPQIETYKKFLQSKPKDFKINQYIDVRVPGKIYVN